MLSFIFMKSVDWVTIHFTIQFNLFIQWDNINLIVSKIDHSEINHLLDRISKLHSRSDHTIISKTLIFYDKINLSIDIANKFIARLSSIVNKISIDIIVASYYNTLNAKVKSKTLADLIKKDIQIMICIDAFDFKIDISNIKIVI